MYIYISPLPAPTYKTAFDPNTNLSVPCFTPLAVTLYLLVNVGAYESHYWLSDHADSEDFAVGN